MKIYFFPFCVAIAMCTAPAFAQEAEPESPVVDRIVLKKKKKKPAAEPVQPIAIPPVPLAEKPLPIPDMAADTTAGAGVGRIGDSLQLLFSSGSKNRLMLGYGHWFNSHYGFSVQAAFKGEKETKTIMPGPRKVHTLASTLTTEGSFYLAIPHGRNLRLFLDTGVGADVTKEARLKFSVSRPISAWYAFTGPGIQWHVAQPFALQLGERIAFTSSRVPNPKSGLELATQLSAAWWFN